jgi:hypothetical protein
MRKIRNPRYAPELLERRLCPSPLASPSGASALYSTPNSTVSLSVASFYGPSSAFYDDTNEPGSDEPYGNARESDPDPNPGDPGLPDPDPGDPPIVPLPPAPVGPAGPG